MSGNYNCFLKNAHKVSRVLPNFICKTTDFQLVFTFEQTCTVTIFGELMHLLTVLLNYSDSDCGDSANRCKQGKQ